MKLVSNSVELRELILTQLESLISSESSLLLKFVLILCVMFKRGLYERENNTQLPLGRYQFSESLQAKSLSVDIEIVQ